LPLLKEGLVAVIVLSASRFRALKCGAELRAYYLVTHSTTWLLSIRSPVRSYLFKLAAW